MTGSSWNNSPASAPSVDRRAPLRIGILSDLHVDRNRGRTNEVVDALTNTLRHNRPDAFICAGDISNDYTESLSVLEELRGATGVPTFFVPGNHDVWNKRHEHLDAWQIHNELRRFTGTLSGRVVELDGEWVLVGETGWYDFSLGSGAYAEEEFERMEIEGRVWQDRLFAQWGMPTREVHRLFLERLRARLERARKRAGRTRHGSKIIMVTHAVPVTDFAVPFRPELWSYLNAFLGSREYGDLAMEFGVSVSICGHVHFRREARHRPTRFICNCLGYRHEWRGNDNAFIEVSRAYREITLH
ncbi:MAG: metallophosphoesterase [Spirochaetaceae bacterium]